MPHHRGLPGWPFAEAIGHLETSPVTVEYVYEGGTVSCGGPGEAPALPESGLKEASFTFADCTPVSKTACYPGSRGGEDAVLSACARFGDHTFFGSPGNAPPLRQQDHRLAARQTFRDCGSNRTCCEGHMLATGASSIEGCVSECRDWDRCAAVNFEPRTGICRLYDSRCTRWTASPGTLFRSSRAACPAQGCPAAPPPPQGYVPFAGCAAGRSCCDAPVRIVHTADLGDCEEACWALGDGNRELCRAVNYYPATKECRMHTNGCDVAGFVAPGVVVTAMNATDCPPARDRPSNLCFPWVGMPAVRRTTSRRPATTKKRTTSRKRTSTKKRTTTKKRRTTTPPIIMPNA
ncbi:hypothetical protein DFJ74DRAFT_238325 [Hyaloraphidium curvatum]|nr:hypothetical protein DFJ74DRAFT_238325 [Hyaloraphidium curvatum]